MQDVSKIHEADERTMLMLEAMPFGCSFWNRDGVILDCNQATLSLFGLPDKKAYIENFESLSPICQPNGEESSKLALRNIQKAFEMGSFRFEWLHQTLSGEIIPSEITLVRIAWHDDFVLVSYMNDLRQLEAARRERDKERLLLKNILDSSPVCMMILVDGKVRFITPYTHEFLGISEGDAISDFHTNPAEVAQIQTELLSSRMLNWRPITIPSVSGGVRDMLGNAFFTEYCGEASLILWLVDITDMRIKERQLLLAKDEAEESARAKSEFLANMSHEIRTPMNAILGMTHLIQRTTLSEKQRDYMDKAEQSCKELLRIVNDILDFSKIEAGKLEMERFPFSVENVMRDAIAAINKSAKEKGLELLLSVPPGIPLEVEGDPLRLHQVLLNLAGNAVKFTVKGNITIGVSVLNSAEDKVILGFSVSDTGIGMSQAQIAGLFSPFSQADTSSTRQYGGTGLGLAICKRLVELMDGAIWCESLPGVGSTFRFTACFSRLSYSSGKFADAEPVADVSENAEKAIEDLASFRGAKILLVEDNAINQMVACELLAICGMVTDIAEKGQEAVEKVLKENYALVLMDIQMPKMDGIEATRAIRAHEKFAALPIIAMTAHAMDRDREKSLQAGMNDHVTKPIDATQLYKTLARWLPKP